jgi:hypothetical protein
MAVVKMPESLKRELRNHRFPLREFAGVRW